MKVYGTEITPAQQEAGIAAMRGQFRASDVELALVRAGVADEIPVPSRATDRLLQRERKAGRIRAITNKIWEPVSDEAAA